MEALHNEKEVNIPEADWDDHFKLAGLFLKSVSLIIPIKVLGGVGFWSGLMLLST